MQFKVIRTGVLPLCLTMCVTACAGQSIVVKPAKCLHPSVDARTTAGLVRGLMQYHAAVNTCNALNGYEAEYGHPKATKEASK